MDRPSKKEPLPRQIEKVREKIEAQIQKKRTSIENIAAYLAKSLANAPTRVKSAPPKKAGGSSTHYTSFTTRLFYPDQGSAEGFRDAGMTMGEYLKKIKGGYRATGSGSFRKEKVQTRVRGTAPPGTYADRNQRPGEFFTKGTGKFSREEREKLRQYRVKESKLRAKLLSPDRKRNAKDQARLQAQLQAVQDRMNAVEKMTAKKLERFQKQEARARNAFQQKVDARREKRLVRMAKFREKNVRYRIVKVHARDVVDPQPATALRKKMPSGTPPKSWPGKGKTNYYISQTQNGVSDSGKKKWVNNYRIKQTGDWSWQVSIRALGGGRTPEALRLVEYGGASQSTPVVMGYIVNTRDVKGGHRRVNFSAVYSDPKPTHAAPHPWVSPTREVVKAYVKKRNGKDINIR